jgi:hypothetical protein
MRKFALASALAAGMMASAAPAHATDFSFTGNFATANDVALFNFSVGAASTVTLRTWSYAGGVNAAGDVIARGGFDPILALFDSTGAFIDQNDDGGFNVAADSVSGNHFDTFFSSVLAPGNYTVSVMAFSNFANGPNLSDGFWGTGSFGSRDTHWAFDVLNVNSAVVQDGAVPEPATWLLMILGFGAIGGAMRNRQRQNVTVRYA